MSDQINLSIGEAPWRPSGDSRVVLELNRYDMPTAGVLFQAGCYYLFECLEGATQSFNVWAYAPVTEYEKNLLADLSGRELFEAMEKIWRTRDATSALAVDDKVLTGAVIDSVTIKRLGIPGAAVGAITDLLDQERSVSHALKEAAN